MVLSCIYQSIGSLTKETAMTAAKIFPEGTSVKQAMDIIVSDADDVIKGACVGMFGMLELTPSYGINLSTVVDVQELGTNKMWDGYMITITQDEASAQQPYEEVCKVGLLQRFIGVNDEGRAVKFIPVGVHAEKMVRWLQ